MNAYNPFESMKRPEATGLERRHAEAFAFEIGEGTDVLVTRKYLKGLLDAAGERHLVRIGLMVSGIVACACTVPGILLSLK